jgi:hypothetical protein
MDSIRLTKQEQCVVDYLCSKNKSKVYWEELAQFAKDPQNVKRKSILRMVSDLKKKFVSADFALPFDVTFASLTAEAAPPSSSTANPAVQKLVQIKRTPAGNTMQVNANLHPAHIDFVLDRNTKRVRTRNGFHQLNDNEWQLFSYIHSNVGRIIPISELRDKVVYPQYGSKLPARWFDGIMRIVNNMRRQVVGLNSRLLTVKGAETSYLFQ